MRMELMLPLILWRGSEGFFWDCCVDLWLNWLVKRWNGRPCEWNGATMCCPAALSPGRSTRDCAVLPAITFKWRHSLSNQTTSHFQVISQGSPRLFRHPSIQMQFNAIGLDFYLFKRMLRWLKVTRVKRLQGILSSALRIANTFDKQSNNGKWYVLYVQWRLKRWSTSGRSTATAFLRSTATRATTCYLISTTTRKATTPWPLPTIPRSMAAWSSIVSTVLTLFHSQSSFRAIFEQFKISFRAD